MIYLLLYDISKNSIRTKVAKLLIEEGFERMQFSIYTGLENPYKNTYLWNKLSKLLKPEPTAKLYVINLSKNNLKNMKIIGTFDQDLDYLIGEKRSLTF